MNIATALERETVDYGEGIQAVPADSGFSADIRGFSFESPTERQVAAVRAAWLDRGVVRFRGYSITDEQQLHFTKMLGNFVKHPRQLAGEEGAHPEHEEILVIGNEMKDGKFAGTMGNSEARWHTDTIIYERPPAAALLHAMKLPSKGGDTFWASMYDVYDRIPDALRKVLEGRQIQLDLVYDGSGRVRVGQKAPETQDFRLWPHIRHPIVRTHGESGRNCLYIGAESDSSWIVGLPIDESRAILAEIMEYVRDPTYQFRQVWEDGDLIMWDNRCTMHRRDGWSADEIRVMHRTTTEGEKPVYVC